MLLDRLGKRYGRRPSSLVLPDGHPLALSLDAACMEAGMYREDHDGRNLRAGAQPVVIVGSL